MDTKHESREGESPQRTFRCPYCRQRLGSEPQTLCPRCGKTMLVPDSVADRSLRDRKKAKERIHRQMEREKAALRIPDASFGRKPSVLLLAMAALALTGAVLVNRSLNVYAPRTDDARMSRAARNLDMLRMALERFRRDCGRYPEAAEGLHALIRDPGIEGWNGPYVNMVRPDPWGRAFHYSVSNDVVVLFSAGPDGVFGTDDDIVPMATHEETANGDSDAPLREGSLIRREINVPVTIGRGRPPTADRLKTED